jgi:CRISPR/Cas system-associated protein Cas10 (large subunit of type III CRISPR-Cas system)
MDNGIYFNVASVAFGLLSAASWLYASKVKISHKKAMEQRARIAEKRGEKPNFASVSLDGWDMSATFSAQSKWNSIGAFFAAVSIIFQSMPQVLSLLAN